jgi:hypothetical protein
MQPSATVKKNVRSWVVARSTARKNLRWRTASERRPNNSNFKHTKTVGPAILGLCGILGIEVAAGKGLGPEGPTDLPPSQVWSFRCKYCSMLTLKGSFAILLRESFREGYKVKKRTIANLSSWPASRIEVFRRLLRGELDVLKQIADQLGMTSATAVSAN